MLDDASVPFAGRRGRTVRSRWRTGSALVTAAAALALILSACGSSTPSSSSTTTTAPKTLTKVTLEIPNPGASFVPFFLGKEEGIYQKYGITLTIDSAINPPLAIQAIESTKLDYMAAIGSAGSAGLHGQPIRVYDVVADHIDFLLLGASGITNISQLVGKTIVGESPVSITNLMEKLMLQHNGVNPKTVTFVTVKGGDAARAALVLAGKAQAVSVEITGALPLEKQGLKVLANTNFVTEPFTGLASSKSFVSSHKQLTTDMIKATTEATNIVRSTETKTVKALEAAPLTLSPSTAKGVWKYMKTEWISGPVPPTSAINNQLTAWKQQYTTLTKPPTETEAFTFTLAKSTT